MLDAQVAEDYRNDWIKRCAAVFKNSGGELKNYRIRFVCGDKAKELCETAKEIFRCESTGEKCSVTVVWDLKNAPVELTSEQLSEKDGEICLGSGQSKYLSSEVSGGFTGVVLGMYAVGGRAEFSALDISYNSYKYRPENG